MESKEQGCNKECLFFYIRILPLHLSLSLSCGCDKFKVTTEKQTVSSFHARHDFIQNEDLKFRTAAVCKHPYLGLTARLMLL